ncbi:MAG: hypothetical protein ACKOCO_05170, partial [Bacteroidota bacterium]
IERLLATDCNDGNIVSVGYLQVVHSHLCLELVQDSLTESKTAHFSPFFTFFQLRSTGYAPSKTQKLTKNQPVFANGRES